MDAFHTKRIHRRTSDQGLPEATDSKSEKKTPGPTPRFQDLPEEVLRRIMYDIGAKASVNLSRMFRRGKDACYDDMLWRHFVVQNFCFYEEHSKSAELLLDTEKRVSVNQALKWYAVDESELPRWMMVFQTLYNASCIFCDRIVVSCLIMPFVDKEEDTLCDSCRDDIAYHDRMYDV